MGLQILLSFLTITILAVITILAYNKRRFARIEAEQKEKLTLDSLLGMIKQDLVDMLKDDSLYGKSGEEWERMYRRQKRISRAMKDCVYGIEKDKIIVKDLIKGRIQEILQTDEEVDAVIDLNNQNINPMIKWEIMAYYLRKDPKIGKRVIKYLFAKYGTDKEKYDIEDHTVPHFAWRRDELELMYQNEVVPRGPIPYLDKLEIISTLLYEKYKGFGCIDTLRDLQIDGLNFGTSGSVLADVLSKGKDIPKFTASVWIYNSGKYIHAEFFDFYSEHEMRRVVQLICRYGNPGPLTEKRGYMVNNMYDQSRVLAVRPPVAECWAVFIRKFDLGGDMNLEKLIDPIKMDEVTKKPLIGEDGQVVHKYHNAQIPYKTIQYLMMGQVTCGFTGRQGSGKTTMMKYALGSADARLTLRILEMTAELYLREVFTGRNILSLQETQWCTPAELQDALKKSDAAISIVGEVATDAVAARMIQMGQVASIFTIFSHHANRTEDLVQALTNSIVASSHGAATPDTVEPQVIDVIKIDVHLDYDVKGNRYIERITEIVRTENVKTYDEIDPSNPLYSLASNQKTFYEKTTDAKRFVCRNILHFDTRTWTYVTDQFFSEALTKHILSRLPEEYIDEFIDFAERNWRAKRANY
mgnify:FL=1